MSSNSKKKTTFAKMNREAAVRERRFQKQARKEARKLAAASVDGPSAPADDASETPVEPGETGERDE